MDELRCSNLSPDANNNFTSFRHIVIGGQPVTVLPTDDEDGKVKGSDVISSFIQREATERSSLEDQRAFFVIDLGDVVRKYRTWINLLPGIVPHYAVKCNDDPVILSVLARLGAGFDCASKNEITKVLDLKDVSVSADRIIYANPVKESSFIRYAAERQVHMMTFDCEEELSKIKKEYPTASLIVRICDASPSSGTEQSLSNKFGCPPSEAVRLIGVAVKLGLSVIGVSFHAGYRVYDTTIYDRIIAAAKFVFDAAFVDFGHRLEVLDIGGGFYGDRNPRLPFQTAASVIRSAISQHFGDELSAGRLRLIAEPGQYMTASACTLAASVIGVRRMSTHAVGTGTGTGTCTGTTSSVDGSALKTSYHYFLNEGVYGSLNSYNIHNRVRLDRQVPYRIQGYQTSQSPAVPNTTTDGASRPTNPEVFDSKLWGPTCDSLDVIDDYVSMERLEVGDWLIFEDLGFYSTSLSCMFNGMPQPEMIHVVEEKYVDHLMMIG